MRSEVSLTQSFSLNFIYHIDFGSFDQCWKKPARKELRAPRAGARPHPQKI